MLVCLSSLFMKGQKGKGQDTDIATVVFFKQGLSLQFTSMSSFEISKSFLFLSFYQRLGTRRGLCLSPQLPHSFTVTVGLGESQELQSFCVYKLQCLLGEGLGGQKLKEINKMNITPHMAQCHMKASDNHSCSTSLVVQLVKRGAFDHFVFRGLPVCKDAISRVSDLESHRMQRCVSQC